MALSAGELITDRTEATEDVHGRDWDSEAPDRLARMAPPHKRRAGTRDLLPNGVLT